MLFLGNGVAIDDLGGYVEDNWSDLPRSCRERVARLRPVRGRRPRDRGPDLPAGVLDDRDHRLLRHIHPSVGITLVESIDGDAGRYGLLVSPCNVADGLTYWFFGADPEPDEPIAEADLWGGLYALTALAICARLPG